MRRVLSCAFFMIAVFLVSTVFGQTGTVCLFGDAQGTQCSITDDGPGLLSVYVIHSPESPLLVGATAVRFAAPKPACMVGATWVTDLSPVGSLVDGNSQTGVALTYAACITEPYHVLTIQYMAAGLSESDCAYGVGPATGWDVIEVVTCDFENAQANGGVTYINSTIPCECDLPTGPPVLSLSPSSIDFGSSITDADFTISNVGGGMLSWSIMENAPWLIVSSMSGTGYFRNGVSVDRAGLAEGTYTTDIVVSSNGGTLPVHVSMEVSQALSVYPATLRFEVDQTEKVLQVTNSGPGTLEWTVSWDRPWLGAYPTEGVDDQEVGVHVDRTGLAVGAYTGTVTVSGGGDVVHVPVTLMVASGQSVAGAIGVFSDPQASGCNLSDQSPGLMTVYVVHVLTTGATGSQFAAPMPACMTGVTYLGEVSPFQVVIGNTQTGMGIGYGSCRSGPILLLTVRFFGQGLSQPCCEYPVVPDSNHGLTQVIMVSCDFLEFEAIGAYAIVNPTPSCQCGSIKVEEATWGRVKSLYSSD